MNERASSCVRAPMSRHCRAASRVGRHREQCVHVGRGLAIRAERKPARLAERAQPVEDGVGARCAVLSVRRARRREVFPPAHLWARSATAPLCSSRARGHW